MVNSLREMAVGASRAMFPETIPLDNLGKFMCVTTSFGFVLLCHYVTFGEEGRGGTFACLLNIPA